MEKFYDEMKKFFKLRDDVIELSKSASIDIKEKFEELDKIKEYNQFKVLRAMQEERVSDSHFTNSSGYGYGDVGRDTLERVYSRVFNTEDALVRPNIVSGTHAITLAIFGNLRPNDCLLSITGRPYDTLLQAIGIEGENNGSMRDYGINYKEIPLKNNKIDIEETLNTIKKDNSIKMIEIQRSTGYGWRPSFTIEEIGEAIQRIKEIRKDIIIFVDNCYGEFLADKEPTDVGADIIAGSLIKNIGGGIAPGGGYIAGKREFVEQAAFRLTAPGLGRECGATYGLMRLFFQGLFLAPHISIEALKTSIFCSRIMELAGYEVSPKYYENRSDIIQAIKFNNPKDLINFCKGIQKGSPVDSFAECEPWDMPGYTDQVIMAAGAFIQGSSIELSADAPIREPYIAYMQGGLTFEHGKIGVMTALSNVLNNKSKASL